MKNLFIIFLLIIPVIGFSQVTELNVFVKRLQTGEIEYSNVDTSYFEVYWNCGMDNGIKLKENLPNGQYNVFYNDIFVYSANYLNGLNIQKDTTMINQKILLERENE